MSLSGAAGRFGGAGAADADAAADAGAAAVAAALGEGAHVLAAVGALSGEHPPAAAGPQPPPQGAPRGEGDESAGDRQTGDEHADVRAGRGVAQDDDAAGVEPGLGPEVGPACSEINRRLRRYVLEALQPELEGL